MALARLHLDVGHFGQFGYVANEAITLAENMGMDDVVEAFEAFIEEDQPDDYE
jgi:hypothetical protein